MDKIHLLLVEDDTNFGSVLKDFLTFNDYEVTHAVDGEDGWKKFNAGRYDLCILDVMMPKKDGFTLAKEIRAVNKQVPIIFLTAKSMKADVLHGYQVGADDYLNKPFDSEVLLYKIKAITERGASDATESNEESQTMFEIGSFTFDSKLRTLSNGDEEYKLSPKENALLKLLCQHIGDLMPRELALVRIWKDDNYFTARSMDVYIVKLRKYLKSDPKVSISNIHGEGFRLIIEE
ncbi:MAG: response regulator transcription factor [Flavobacteriales bacterium]|jgi:DNA-binding response OmpR family regulator|nr:response regulator transcription factor [Flavobacteriales bacterium]MBQ1968131.1 response regulator transcription factor [Flavobacteriales bacterium]